MTKGCGDDKGNMKKDRRDAELTKGTWERTEGTGEGQRGRGRIKRDNGRRVNICGI